MKHFMPSMLKAVMMAVGIRNYNVSGCYREEIKMQTKYTNSVLKGFPMAAYNDDDGDIVERNYIVSSSTLDMAYNYLEEALQIIGTPFEEIPKLIPNGESGSCGISGEFHSGSCGMVRTNTFILS